jgi:hypothetical protein
MGINSSPSWVLSCAFAEKNQHCTSLYGLLAVRISSYGAQNTEIGLVHSDERGKPALRPVRPVGGNQGHTAPKYRRPLYPWA